MKTHKTTITVWFWIMILVPGWAGLRAQDLRLEVTASVAMEGREFSAAYRAAVAEARGKLAATALERAVGRGDAAVAATLAEQFDVYFTQWRVLDSRPDGAAGTLSLRAEARTDRERIRAVAHEQGLRGGEGQAEDAGPGRFVGGARPRLAVLVREIYETEADAPPTVEPALAQWFTDAGFPVVELPRRGEAALREQGARAQANDAEALAALAAATRAEWLVLGTARLRSSAGLQGSDMRPYQASLSLRVLEADRGGVIATAHGNGFVPHINELTGGQLAFGRALEEAREPLREGINRMLAENSAHPLSGRITLRFFGVVGPRDQAFLREALPRLESVRAVEWRGSAGTVAEAEVSLRQRQSTEEFIGELERQQGLTRRLRVVHHSPRVLTLQLLSGAGDGPEGLDSGELLETLRATQFEPVDEERVREGNAALRTRMEELSRAFAREGESLRELQEARAALEQTQTRLFHAESERRALERQLQEAMAESERLRQELEILTARVGETRARNSALSGQIEAAERRRDHLARQLEEKEREVGAARREHAAIRSRIQSFRAN